MNEQLMEGNYSHYDNDVIDELALQYEIAMTYITDLIVNYKPFKIDDIYEYLKDYGFYRHKDGSIYKTLKFRPEEEELVKANNETPLGISFSIAVQPENYVRKATYQRGLGLIDLNVALLRNHIDDYNRMLDEVEISPDLKSYKDLKSLQELREQMLYYIDPYLLRSTLVHEMTHWLDNVYDDSIYDATYDTTKWIWIKSEINAILHQAKFLNHIIKKDFWSELTIVDILVLIRIRRDFLGEVMLQHQKNKKDSWISDFIKLLTQEGIEVDSLKRNDNFENYYKMDLIGEREVYRNYYFFLRRNIF